MGKGGQKGISSRQSAFLSSFSLHRSTFIIDHHRHHRHHDDDDDDDDDPHQHHQLLYLHRNDSSKFGGILRFMCL